MRRSKILSIALAQLLFLCAFAPRVCLSEPSATEQGTTRAEPQGAVHSNQNSDAASPVAGNEIRLERDIFKPSATAECRNAPAQRTIYYRPDEFHIQDKYRDMLLAHAQFLSGHKACKLLIAGNSNEHTGREYNLAFGQKRSELVRERLVLLGAPDEQVYAISFGSQKPAHQGKNERARAKNRRSDFIYP